MITMNDDYICQHLIKFIQVLNPGQPGYSFKKGKRFVFGLFKGDKPNIVSKQLAIYLSIGIHVDEVKKKVKKVKKIKRRRRIKNAN